MTCNKTNSTEEIINLDKKYYMPTFGQRFPICVDHGKGCTLYDIDGKEYLDFVAGIAVNSLGYGNVGFNNALKSQIDKFIHCSNYFYNAPQTLLAKGLCEYMEQAYKTPFHAFFANSGAEANEGAIKLCRKYFFDKGNPLKNEILTMHNSFHGRTLATLAATGQPKFHEPFMPLIKQFNYFTPNDITDLKSKITKNTAGILLEVIQGESGVNQITKEFLKSVRELCDTNNILLMIDEVQTGMGRCGTLFGFENFGVVPDIFTLAKGLGGGFPVGAILSKKEIAFAVSDHGTTFGGNPLACTAGNYVLDQLLNHNLLENVKEMGNLLKEQLEKTTKKYSFCSSVRGEGLLLGFSLDEKYLNKTFIKSCIQDGLLLAPAANNTIRFIPPLVVTKNDIDKCINILDKNLQNLT